MTLRGTWAAIFVCVCCNAGAAQTVKNPCTSVAGMTNPCVTVRFEHPPDLVPVERAVFAPVVGEGCAETVVRTLSSRFAANRTAVVDTDTLVQELTRAEKPLQTFIETPDAIGIGEVLGSGVLLIVREDRCEAERREYSRNETRTRYVTATKTTQSGSARAEETRTGTKTSTRSKSGVEETAGSERTETRVRESYQVPVYVSEIESFIGVSVQAVDLADGRIFAPRMLEVGRSDSNKSEGGYPEYPSETALRATAAEELVDGMRTWFWPYPVTRNFVFFDTVSKRCNLKMAARAFKSLDFVRALELSELNSRTCMDSPRKRYQSNAHYNLGVVRRVREEYGRALQSFLVASELNPERTVVWDAMAETRNTVQEREALAMQEILSQTTLPIDVSATPDPPAEPEEPEFTNADVIKLTQAQIPTSIVIGKVLTATRWSFDLSAEAIANLVESGVHEDVVLKMMEKGSQ